VSGGESGPQNKLKANMLQERNREPPL